MTKPAQITANSNNFRYPAILIDQPNIPGNWTVTQEPTDRSANTRSTSRTADSREPCRLNVLILAGVGRSHAPIANCAAQWGHNLWSAHSRRALEEIANHHPINVLLLDLQLALPQVSAVAQWFKRKWTNANCLAIAVMNRVDLEEVKSASVAGIDLSLLDPVDHNVLEMLLLLEATFVNRKFQNCSGKSMQL